MKAAAKKNTNLAIGAMLVVAVGAFAFWALLLSPKRDEAAKLSEQIKTVETSLSQHRAEAQTAAAAKESFSTDYEHLVVLGKAVPREAETPSLLIQLEAIAAKSGVEFESLELEQASGEGEAPEAEPESLTSATEAEASLLPLGASIGPAGLAVMPYSLTFQGSFFKVARFIEGLDKLVKTTNANVAVDGRLITVNGFTFEPGEDGFPQLQATFKVTTYLTPPGESVTAGATPEGVEGGSTLASSTTGTAP
jgi:Tfp pilus assembly protein PilO